MSLKLKLKKSRTSTWVLGSTRDSQSNSPCRKTNEQILQKYVDIIDSKSDISNKGERSDKNESQCACFDDDEIGSTVTFISNNVACTSDNMKKLLLAQEPWPDNVKLFQPYEVEQILLPDNASCLAVQAFLKMCNLPFEVEMRWNAEFMSPSGRVPFIKCGAFVVSELEPVAQFAANKGVSLCGRLTTEEKAEMRAYMSLITNVLVNAELWISWIDDETYNAVTKVRNSSVYPWPLGWVQTRTKRNMVAKRLKALHWHDKTLDQVMADVDQCCNSLSQRLGDKDYFFGTPTALDALIYGHVRALLGASGPRAALMVGHVTTNLMFHMLRIANMTKMALTPQEESLVSQVCVTRQSPERPRVFRRHPWPARRARDGHGDMFGFKPFASKQITLISNNEGVSSKKKSPHFPTEYDFILEILDNVLENIEYNKLEDKDFDFVEFSSSEIGDVKPSVLEMITEDFMVHMEDAGLADVNDGYSENEHVQDSSIQESDNEPSVADTLEFGAVSETEDSVLAPTCSVSTLKRTSSEDITVKKLIEYIRQKNDQLNRPFVADLD